MPLCEGCGAPYDDAFKFCPHCARPKPEPKRIEISVETKPAASPYDCPLCGDSGSIQKVTAICDHDTAVTEGSMVSHADSRLYSASSGNHIGDARSTSSTEIYKQTQSRLAGKLTLPPEPNEPHRSQFDVDITNNFFGKALMVILYLCFLGLGYEVLSMFISSDVLVAVASMFCFAPIFLTLAVIGISEIINSMRKSKEKYQHAHQNYLKEKARYQLVLDQWKDLYYCHKHDIVYTLSRREPAPLDQAIDACIRWAFEPAKEESR